MKAVVISDTHNLHEYLTLPPGDILIHAGDFTRSGTVQEFERFGKWLQDLPYKYIIVTYGNHDWLGQEDPVLAEKLLGRANVLHEKSLEIEGIRFYGAAWQPEFYQWAFNVPRDATAVKNWAKIPEDTNVLITHGPPYGTLDFVSDGLSVENVGCAALAERILALPNLTTSIFGHIHENHGVVKKGEITYINVSSTNDLYSNIFPPIEVLL
jgi:Icc-related predicted phosphoesterase